MKILQTRKTSSKSKKTKFHNRKKLKISQDTILLFTEELKLLLESGITISTALEILISKDDTSNFSSIVLQIRKSILNGENIYSSFSKFKDVFGERYLNFISVGEEAGNLAKNLEKICENIKLQKKIGSKIKEALFYPMIVVIFTIALVIFMMGFVFPNFIELFKDSRTQLPALTQFLITISDNILFISFIAIVFFIILILLIKRTSREKIENIKLKTPFLKNIIIKDAIISFSSSFYIMNEAGMGIIITLNLIKKSTSYIFMKRNIQSIEESIKQGNTISDAFSSFKLFSSSHLKMIAIGEKTGTLPKSFKAISNSLEKELELYLIKMTILLEPLLLLILGLIVGTVILAIYLPIFNLSETIL